MTHTLPTPPPEAGHSHLVLLSVVALILALALLFFCRAVQIGSGVYDNEVDRFRERRQRDAGPHHHKKREEKS